MNSINKVDLKILQELEEDSRKTSSNIGKSLNLSQQVISYRISNLIKQGIIKEFYTMIDFGKLGFSSYRIMIKLKDISKKEKDDFIDYISKSKNILWFVECGEEWDLILNIMARSSYEFEELFGVLLKEHSEIILDYDTLFTIKGIYFGRRYLFGKQGINKPSFAGSNEISEINETDKKILNEISENARMNSVDIEKRIKVNYKTVLSRINSLKKENIITGFKPLIDLEKIGYQSYKLLIDLKKLSKKEEQEFIDFLYTDKRIIGILKMIGKWNFEVEFEVKEQKEIWDIYKKTYEFLKEKSSKITLLPLFKEYKYNYFPDTLI
jgi:Lrp/AsnC family transcriptional regulator, leucine-responsive regulatory protein